MKIHLDQTLLLLLCVGKDAIAMNRQLHDQRIITNGIPSPETGGKILFFD